MSIRIDWIVLTEPQSDVGTANLCQFSALPSIFQATQTRYGHAVWDGFAMPSLCLFFLYFSLLMLNGTIML